MRKYIIISTVLFGLGWIYADSQLDKSLSAQDINVTLSTYVQPNQVPLNRTVQLTVQITWKGDMDLVRVDEIEEPILTNFDIIGTASSNQITGTAEGRKSTKEIIYTLMPRSLGMGYVESVTLTYVDQATEKSHALMTQRIGVEIISPVAEPGEVKIPWIIIFICFILLLMLIAYIFYKRKRNVLEENEPSVLIEESYLHELKNSTNLNESDRHKPLSFIIKLIRRYLAEKYQISALEATTDDLIFLLKEHDAEDSLIQKCEMLLKKTDVIQFSGSEVSQAELDEAYTVVEMILEKELAQVNEKLKKEEEEKKKKHNKR